MLSYYGIYNGGSGDYLVPRYRFILKGGMMMRKKQYERTQLDVIVFQSKDVIMTSGEEYEDDIIGQNKH